MSTIDYAHVSCCTGSKTRRAVFLYIIPMRALTAVQYDPGHARARERIINTFTRKLPKHAFVTSFVFTKTVKIIGTYTDELTRLR